MIRWNGKRLAELVRDMGLRRVRGQGKTPIHLSLYGNLEDSGPFLAHVMQLNAKEWSTLGYDETDRVSLVQYLGSLGCRADGALLRAVEYQ